MINLLWIIVKRLETQSIEIYWKEHWFIELYHLLFVPHNIWLRDGEITITIIWFLLYIGITRSFVLRRLELYYFCEYWILFEGKKFNVIFGISHFFIIVVSRSPPINCTTQQKTPLMPYALQINTILFIQIYSQKNTNWLTLFHFYHCIIKPLYCSYG